MSVDPDNAEELIGIAREVGAEVLRGHLRYPSETGVWQLDDVESLVVAPRLGDLDVGYHPTLRPTLGWLPEVAHCAAMIAGYELSADQN